MTKKLDALSVLLLVSMVALVVWSISQGLALGAAAWSCAATAQLFIVLDGHRGA